MTRIDVDGDTDHGGPTRHFNRYLISAFCTDSGSEQGARKINKRYVSLIKLQEGYYTVPGDDDDGSAICRV